MQKRTIKAPAGHSRISTADAELAARYVYRDSVTGRFIVSKEKSAPTGRHVMKSLMRRNSSSKKR